MSNLFTPPTLKVAASILALLVAAYIALKAIRRVPDTQASASGRISSGLMVTWMIVAALLPWKTDTFLPFLPKVSLVLGLILVVVSGLDARRTIRSADGRAGMDSSR